jgi:hypothetical protein
LPRFEKIAPGRPKSSHSFGEKLIDADALAHWDAWTFPLVWWSVSLFYAWLDEALRVPAPAESADGDEPGAEPPPRLDVCLASSSSSRKQEKMSAVSRDRAFTGKWRLHDVKIATICGLAMTPLSGLFIGAFASRSHGVDEGLCPPFAIVQSFAN